MIKTTYVYTQTSPPETSNAVSTVLTSEFYSSHDLTTAITVKQAYAVNGTASAYTTIPAETKTFTTRVDYLSAPYTEPRPTCSPSTTTQCVFSKDCRKCTISGGTVQLLYFPHGVGNDRLREHDDWCPSEARDGDVREYHLTSPSVYISFYTAYAHNECGSQVGKRYPGAILPLNPDELSSVYGLYGTLYSTLSDPLFPVPVTSAYLKAASFNLADLNWPVPVSAYQNQPKFKLGGEIFSVVFDDYRPVLAVPPQIREMDPAWKTCELDWEGLYDPPKALQPARTMAGVTTPTGGEIEPTDPPSPSSGPESPASRTTSAGVQTQTSALAFGNADPRSSGKSVVQPYQTDAPLLKTGRPVDDPIQTANSADGQRSLVSNDLDESHVVESGSVMADPTADPKSFVSSRRPSSGLPNSVAGPSKENMPLPTEAIDNPGADDLRIDNTPSIATSTIQFATTKNDYMGTVNSPDPSFESSTPSSTSDSAHLETKTMLTKSVVVGSISSGSEESPQAGGLESGETSGHSKSHQDPVATAVIAGLGADNVGGGGKPAAGKDPNSASFEGGSGTVVDLHGSTVKGTAANQAAQGTAPRGTLTMDGQTAQTAAGEGTNSASQIPGVQGVDSKDMSTPTQMTDPGDNGLPPIASISSGSSDTVATVTIEGQSYTATKADSDVVIVNHRTISAGGSGLPIPHATLTVADNGELQMVYTKTGTQNSKSHQPSDTETLNRGVELSFPSTTLTAMEGKGISKTVLVLGGQTLSVGGQPATVAGNIISAVNDGVIVGSARHSTTASLYDIPVTVTEASSSISSTTGTRDGQSTADSESSLTSGESSSSTSGGRLGSQPVQIWFGLASFTVAMLSCT
ncbi:hypothetical protein NU219Hw_g857t1 [Hortaea werneckii]